MRPVVLRSLMEICVYMGVGPETVRRWLCEGAPIALEGSAGKSRYSCEASALQAWRLEKSREKKGEADARKR